MSQNRGFTLIEAMVVVAVLLVLFVLFNPFECGWGGSRVLANRAVCGANLSGLYKAMYTYSTEHKDWFPIAGAADSAGNAHGFAKELRGIEQAKPTDAAMVNNVTASLWMLVRDGSVGIKSYICPQSGNKPDLLLDDHGKALKLSETWDFAAAENLSYSPINMYYGPARAQWNANLLPDFIIMGDNNNADGQGVHYQVDRGDYRAMTRENSRNHMGEGQELTFGDGHVQFITNPFVGPHDDNVYAMQSLGTEVPPSLSNSTGDALADDATAKEDCVLIPITGNNGVSLSGLATTSMSLHASDLMWLWHAMAWALVLGVAIGLYLLIERGARAARDATNAEPGGDQDD